MPRRRALRRQGAGAEEPGDQLHPGRAADQAAAADGLADPLDADRHHQHRGRGAAARGAADQALPAALQRAAARRQKLPLHPAARGPCFPAGPAPSRRAAPQGPILRAVRQRRLGHATRSTRCRSCSCCGAAPTASSPTARGPACSTRSAAARRPASAGSTRPAMPSWSSDAKDFLGGKSTKVQQKLGAADERGVRGDGFRARRRLSATGCAR